MIFRNTVPNYLLSSIPFKIPNDGVMFRPALHKIELWIHNIKKRLV